MQARATTAMKLFYVHRVRWLGVLLPYRMRTLGVERMNEQSAQVAILRFAHVATTRPFESRRAASALAFLPHAVFVPTSFLGTAR